MNKDWAEDMRQRNYNIDVLKGLAILSVILLHTLPWSIRFRVGAPYHIWQAVPIFMVLVGYNFAKSAQVKGRESLGQLYQGKLIWRRLVKIIQPFVLVMLVRLVLELVLYQRLDLANFLTDLFLGDIDFGGYYIPIMVQSIFLNPILYWLIRQNTKQNTLLLLVLSFGLDWGLNLVGLPGGLYRILIVRYLFAIVLGMWLALAEERVQLKWLLALAGLSLIYITGVYYFDLTTPLETYWQAQHGPAYFWTLLLVFLGLHAYQAKSDHWLGRPLIWLGQTSYPIFLSQMLYFWLMSQLTSPSNLGLSLIFNLIICVFLGKILEKFTQT